MSERKPRCADCAHFGSRVRKESGEHWSEAYCRHDSIAPGAGAFGVEYSAEIEPPAWCPLLLPSGQRMEQLAKEIFETAFTMREDDGGA